VVFRGFSTSDALRDITDLSVEERIKLKVQTTTEQERQKKLDFQLAKREDRARNENWAQNLIIFEFKQLSNEITTVANV
jgi:hypothetical protein